MNPAMAFAEPRGPRTTVWETLRWRYHTVKNQFTMAHDIDKDKSYNYTDTVRRDIMHPSENRNVGSTRTQ